MPVDTTLTYYQIVSVCQSLGRLGCQSHAAKALGTADHTPHPAKGLSIMKHNNASNSHPSPVIRRKNQSGGHVSTHAWEFSSSPGIVTLQAKGPGFTRKICTKFKRTRTSQLGSRRPWRYTSGHLHISLSVGSASQLLCPSASFVTSELSGLLRTVPTTCTYLIQLHQWLWCPYSTTLNPSDPNNSEETRTPNPSLS